MAYWSGSGGGVISPIANVQVLRFKKALTAEDISNKYIDLPETGISIISVDVLGGDTAIVNDDVTIDGSRVSWGGKLYEETLHEDDVIFITFLKTS